MTNRGTFAVVGAAMPDYAARVKTLMAASGEMSVYSLAEATGLSEGTLGAILRGETVRPRKKTLELIARAFGISLAELQGDAEVEPRFEASHLVTASNTDGTVPLAVEVPEETYDVLSAVASIERSTHHNVTVKVLADWTLAAVRRPGVQQVLDAIRSSRAPQGVGTRGS